MSANSHPRLMHMETGDYADLLRGRRVAIVGAADTTKGKGQGARIDAYDLIVRINNAWPVRPEMTADLGSRMDILYHCCNSHSPIARLDLPQFANVKFAWYETNVESDQLIALCAKYGVPCAPFDRLRQALTADLGSVPNTGTIAIAQMLSTDLKELHVTGFSFYSTYYYDGYAAKGAKWKYWWRKRPDSIGMHVFEPQRRFFRAAVESDKRITLDAPLQELVQSW